MRKEFHKNDSFRNEIGIPPPEFEIPENYNEKEEKEKSQTPETTTKDQNQAEKPADIDTSPPTPPEEPEEAEPQITELPVEAPK